MAGNSTTFNIGIKTTADLSGIEQVKKSLQEIQNLAKNGDFVGGKSREEIQSMVAAAKQLDYALTSAMDTDLGIINLQKFNAALKTSGTSITTLKNDLGQAGSVGQKAFLQVTGQLLKMNTAVKQVNPLFDKLKTTFLNTIRWQVTSSILNNITGSFSKMYNYVKDLDKSLNNIQIVTQKSSEDMEKFAKNANEAAQALGTKTTTFTDAALIYYQQGLSDEEALARTETTVKMANVMGETASTVSDYMTAIWNNFEDGSHTVEYFADVITNLGAHTASSAEEIAEGLEKFASVANTVGLSYEYATTALATVVAQTRQSADTVGTAFKTLFARIQDLELGDTLDDGTTLGTYSQALEKVGINIKDQQGELKDMNEILDEMGKKWQTLSKDQQVALAQNVAGTRQYTQLVALMDNWDTFNQNLETANNSEGRLAEEQETYMESIKAHVQELNAAAEDLYDSVLNSGSVNGVLTFGTNVIKIVTRLADGLGNLPGILTLVGSLALKAFGPQIAQSMATMANNMELEAHRASEIKNQYALIAQLSPELATKASFSGNLAGENQAMNASVRELISLYQELGQVQDYLTTEEKQQYNQLIENKIAASEFGIELEEALNLNSNTALKGMLGADFGQNIENSVQKVTALTNEFSGLITALDQTDIQQKKINRTLDSGKKQYKELEFLINGVIEQLTKAGISTGEFENLFNECTTESSFNLEKFKNKIQEITNSANGLDNVARQFNALSTAADSVGSTLIANGQLKQAVTNLTQAGTQIGMLATSVSSLISLFSTLNNEELSAGEKALRVTTSLSMMIPMIASSVTNLVSSWGSLGGSLATITTRMIAGVEGATALSLAEQNLNKIKENGLVIDELKEKFAKAAMAGDLEETGIITTQIEALKRENDQLIKQSKLELINSGLCDEDSASRLLNSGSIDKETGSITLNTVALKENIKSMAAWIAEAAAAYWPLLAIAGAIAAVIIAVKAVEAYQDRYNKTLEESQEILSDLSNTYDTLKSEAEEFKSTISDYGEAIESLKDLTAGTQDYKDALKEANDAAWELINTDSNLEYAGKVNGAVQVKDKSTNALIDTDNYTSTIDKQAANAEIAELIQKQTVNKNQQQADAYSYALSNGIKLDSDTLSSLKSLYKSGNLGSEDALMELDYGFKTEAEQLDFVSSLLGENKKELEDLISSNIQLDETNQALNEQIAATINETYNEDYQNADDQTKAIYDQAMAGRIAAETEANEGKYEGPTWQQSVAMSYGATAEQVGLSSTNFMSSDAKAEQLKTQMGFAYSSYDKDSKQWEFWNDEEDKVSYSIDDLNNALASLDAQAAVTSDTIEADLIEGVTKTKDALSGYDGVWTTLSQSSGGSINLADMTQSEAAGMDLSQVIQSLKDNRGLLEAGGFDNWDEYFVSLGYDSAAAFWGAYQDALDERASTSDLDFLADQGTALRESAATLFTDVQSGDVTSENIASDENYTALQDKLDTIKALFPELTEACEIFNNENLTGTEEWYDALDSIEDKMNEVALYSAKGDYQDTLDSVLDDVNNQLEKESNGRGGKQTEFSINGLLTLDDEEFEDDLEKIMDAEYAIDVEIHAEAEDAFDEIENEVDGISEAAQKIGENYVVAADDVRELNNVFPGILENATLLTDGTYKLSQQSVQDSMNAAQAELAADAEETTGELENQATILRAKQAHYQALADIATQAANGQLKNSEATTKAQAEYDEIESLNDQQKTDAELTNDISVANSANENGAITAENWTAAYQTATEASAAFASAAVQNMKTAANGSGDIKSTIKVTPYSGAQGQSSEQSTLANIKKDIDSGDKWSEVASSAQQMADYLDSAATDIEGMIAQVAAGVQGTATGTQNVEKGSGYSPSSSGSGSDGSDSISEKDYADYDDDFDKFHDFTEAIEESERALEKLQDTEEHVFGDELVENLKEQTQELANQKAIYEAKAAAEKSDLEQRRNALSAYGVTFDDDGQISNYNAATVAWNNKYNEAVSQYNSGLISEDTFDALEKQYEAFKESVSDYDDAYDQWTEDIDKADELAQEIRDNNLKQITAQVEYVVDQEDIRRQLAEAAADVPVHFNADGLEEGDFTLKYQDLNKQSQASAVDVDSYLNEEAEYKAEAAKYKEELAKINAGGTSDLFASASEAQKAIDEAEVNAANSRTKAYQAWEDTYNNYLDGIDQSADRLEEVNEEYERLSKTLDHAKTLSELLYGENDYDNQLAITQAQEQNQLAQMDSYKQQADMWNQYYLQAVEDGDEQAAAKYKELYEDAMDDLYQTEEDYVQSLLDEYATTVKKTFSDLESDITGGSSFDWLSEQWDLTKDAEDGTYDDVERVYQIDKLSNSYEKLLKTNSGNLKIQQKIKAQMDAEVKALEEKEELSEYDVELAEKHLAVLEAEAALEDAQNNKNTMKLSRDTSGNWSYQYVADDDDIADKQQAVADAQNEAYEYTKQGWQEVEEQLLETQQTALETIQSIEEKMVSATDEEKVKLQEQLDWYNEYYYGENGRIAKLSKESAERETNYKSETMAAIAEYYKEDASNYSLMTTEEQGLLDTLRSNQITSASDVYTYVAGDSTGVYDKIYSKAETVLSNTEELWNTNAKKVIDTWNADNGESVKNKVQAAMDACSKAQDDFQLKVDAGTKAAGEDFSTLKTTYIDPVNTAISGLSGTTQTVCSDIKNYLSGLYETYRTTVDYWNKIRDAAVEAANAVSNYNGSVPSANTYSSTPSTTTTSNGSNGSNGNSTGNTTSPTETTTQKVTYNFYASNGSLAASQILKGSFSSGIASAKALGDGKNYTVVKYVNGVRNSSKSNQLSAWDTGGYTGDWGTSDGKLALLHQKELVLNAEDTPNILEAVSAVRDLSSLGSNISNAIVDNISSLMSNILTGKVGDISTNTNTNTNDNVFNITAEFPNANDVTEIREAILSLPNLASQYLGRR